MSSDSEISSEQISDQQSRLHSIWKSIRETKNLSHNNRNVLEDHEDRSVNQVKRTQQVSFTRSKLQNEHLREDQLKQNLTHMAQKWQQSLKEIQYLKNEIERIKTAARQDLQDQRRQYQSKIRKQLKKLKTTQKENVCQNNEEKVRIQSLTKQIDRLNLRIRSLDLEKKGVQAEVIRLSQLNQNYLEKREEEGSEWMVHQTKGEQLLQLSEAQNTIDRLLQLLKRTEQFRQIAPLLEEAKGLHYLKNIVKKIKIGQINFASNNKKVCTCTASKVSEKLLWSPAECYRLLLGLKLKYDYLSEDCIEEVLFEMNRIYSSRQQRRVSKLKDHYNNDIKLLRKKFQESYDELLAKKQINRLKKQLRVAKSAKKSHPASKLQDLRNQGQVQDELKLKIREIKLLQQRIRLLQTQHGYNDKSLYWEGALWMIDRVLSDIEENEGGVKQFEISFRDNLDSNIEAEDWLKSYKQFFERLSQMNCSLVEKLLAIKETALRKMSQ